MSWSMVRMSDADVGKLQHFRLQTQFEAIFTTALAPKAAAMFGNRHPGKEDHIFYFSPKAGQIFAALLSAWSPKDCPAPTRESVALLVGHADAWDMLATEASKA